MDRLMRIIFIAVISIAVFVALREFFCWYFKINEIRNLLKRIVELSESKNRDPGTE